MKKCEKCSSEVAENVKFCGKCGEKVNEPVSTYTTLEQTLALKESPVIIKCGNCEYIGEGEKARSTGAMILAWLCVLFAPIITIIYFATTHKYRCPKCKSTFLGIKNKEGVFAGQRGGAGRIAMIFISVLVGIAILGIMASVVLASLNAARQKAKEAQGITQQSEWQIFNSVNDNFSVLLPTYPTSESVNDKTDSGMSYRYDTFTSEEGSNYYIIIKYTYSGEVDLSNEDSSLEGMMNRFINGIDGTLISSNYDYYDSYRTLDFVSTNKDGSFKGRIILAGQTPYLLIAGYPTGGNIELDYIKFINSLNFN